MIIVLDCDAAIEIVFNRNKGKALRELIATAEKTVSSELFRIEVANVLRKYYQGDHIKKAECGKALELAENLIDEFIPIKENHQEALHESIRLKRSAYDMLYLTIARRMGATLVTLDKSLNAIADNEGIDTVRGAWQ